ncbi:hypothetical protein AAW00_03975 [Aurantiacibacter luteus]|uniref:DUF11 domain-containing protein n=2 Tax=Aurantiacibacter luteus TaxID=1581420 RepID=A0A0G9MZB2_9SPHN|nr:hypothetical protein AAW00_03975 [Aurantiacibacter luteus]
MFVAATCAIIAAPERALAQSTATVDWTTTNAPSGGVLPNPVTATASDGSTTATVSYATVANGTAFTPILGSFVSYYDPVFGGFAGSLLMNFDNSAYDPGDKLTTTVVLNRAVTGLQFSVTDIDANNWIDAVEVYYQDAGGTWRNAADTAAFYTAGTAATRTTNATVNGWRGTANVAAEQTTGNVNFNFGNTLVQGVRIVYFSYTGTGDPGGQVAGITDLTFNRAFADLSLAKTLLTASPTTGNTATFRLTLTNSAASSLSATGVQVRDTLPAGFTFNSSSGTGTFSPATGLWSVGTLARNQTVTIDITGVVTATSGAVLANRAEVSASNQFDPDSTPANGVTTEDDYATALLTVGGTRTAGIAPNLVCPNQSIVFDWDNVTWAAGSTANTYALGTLGNVAFNLTNNGAWLNNAAFGGQSPNRQNVFTGGILTPQFSLGQIVDQTSQAGRATTTITLPEIMRGAQFSIFDVDSNPGQFADLVVVEGRYKGATVVPTLTNGLANYVVGNAAYGDGASDNNAANGNVVVTFSQPIDTIVISYGNHAAAPADPGQQGIALHDITFCRPSTTLTVDKTSRLLNDPVDFGDEDYRIPGAIIEYCLLTANTGDTRATDVVISDVLPANLTFVSGSIRSGATCSGATTIEDDDATGTDEADPVGAQYRNNREIYATSASLAAGTSIAIVFQAQIN